MIHFANQHGLKVIAGLALAILLLSFFTSTGLWNVDELIYFLGADALASNGSFIISNGYETYPHPDLQVMFLIPGPNGLTSQYPVGTTLLGAPMIALLGVRGVVVLNALAASIGLGLTYRLARQLYEDSAVALFAVLILCFSSFYLEFAFGAGSHVLGVVAVLAALTMAVQAIQTGAFLPAVMSGLAIGLGILIRVDTILILPAIGLVLLLFSPRFWRHVVGGLIGLVPGLALGAFSNAFKFGTFNPLSYGYESGPANLSGHATSIAAMAVVLSGCLVLRRLTWRPNFRSPILVIFLGVIAAGVLGVPMLDRLVQGAYFLLIDIRQIFDDRPGMKPIEDGVRIFFGQEKKALAQSLPWLGLATALFLRTWEQRSSHLILLVVFGLWVLPFSFLHWHGGFGSNMRYFLPLLPLASILIAALLTECQAESPSSARLLFLALLGGVLVTTLWSTLHPQSWASAGQQLGLWTFFLVVTVCILCEIVPAFSPTRLIVVFFAIGVSFTLSGLRDLTLSQKYRIRHAELGNELEKLPRPNAFVAPVTPLSFQSRREDGLIITPHLPEQVLDPMLLEQLLKDGFHVYVDAPDLEAFLANNPNLDVAPKQPEFSKPSMVELSLSEG